MLHDRRIDLQVCLECCAWRRNLRLLKQLQPILEAKQELYEKNVDTNEMKG